MLTAISRYGARVLPNTEKLVAACKARGEFIQGAQIAEFEDAFARRAGGGIAVTAAYGRMAFYFMLMAMRPKAAVTAMPPPARRANRSEEHTSALQSRTKLLCRPPPEQKTTTDT